MSIYRELRKIIDVNRIGPNRNVQQALSAAGITCRGSGDHQAPVMGIAAEGVK